MLKDIWDIKFRKNPSKHLEFMKFWIFQKKGIFAQSPTKFKF